VSDLYEGKHSSPGTIPGSASTRGPGGLVSRSGQHPALVELLEGQLMKLPRPRLPHSRAVDGSRERRLQIIHEGSATHRKLTSSKP
jgi:hypothetical protein